MKALLTQEQILHTISANKERFHEIGVQKIGLFGSYIRNEQTYKSDIDFLVDFIPNFETYDNLVYLYDLLNELFENNVIQVVTARGLSPYIGSKILEEVSYAQIAA